MHFDDKYFCVQTTDTGLSLSWYKLVLLHQPQFPFLSSQYCYLKKTVCREMTGNIPMDPGVKSPVGPAF